MSNFIPARAIVSVRNLVSYCLLLNGKIVNKTKEKLIWLVPLKMNINIMTIAPASGLNIATLLVGSRIGLSTIPIRSSASYDIEFSKLLGGNMGPHGDNTWWHGECLLYLPVEFSVVLQISKPDINTLHSKVLKMKALK